MIKKIFYVMLIIVLTLTLTVNTPTAYAADKEIQISNKDIEKIAKTLYGECRSSKIPTMEKAAVVWCILNRCDAWNKTIDDVIVKSQFHGYNKNNPLTDELVSITKDVVGRWYLEKAGITPWSGRVLPKKYLYFAGRNGRNYFRSQYRSKDYWNWNCYNPYVIGGYYE